MDHFADFLNGSGDTVVYTDHQALVGWAAGAWGADALLSRWGLKLRDYPVQIKYVNGVENGVADFLSRRVQGQREPSDKFWVDNSGNLLEAQGRRAQELRRVQQGDSDPPQEVGDKTSEHEFTWDPLMKIGYYKRVASPENRAQGARRNPPRAARETFGGVLRAPADRNERLDWLTDIHLTGNHAPVRAMLAYLQGQVDWPTKRQEVEEVVSVCDLCQREELARPPVRRHW